ncbi:MAG: DUF3298 domain-containing protein [Campylobacter sp.]|nr:DUF3298 domain-containing protein [Campylobacter sp.]
MKKLATIALFALFSYAQINPQSQELYSDDAHSYTLVQTGNENLDILLKNRLFGICEGESIDERCALLLKSLDAKKYATSLVEQSKAQADKEMAQNGDLDFHSEFSAEQSFVSQIGNLAQIKQFSYSYSGGAHGMEHTSYIIYDLLANKKIDIANVLIGAVSVEPLYKEIFKGYKDMLRADIIASQPNCDKACQERDITEFIKTFWVDNLPEDIVFKSEFYFAKEGVAFVFAPYFIAPYAMGEPEIIVPYENLKGIFKEEFLKF